MNSDCHFVNFVIVYSNALKIRQNFLERKFSQLSFEIEVVHELFIRDFLFLFIFLAV